MRGFTLIEILLAISIIALIGGFSLPVYTRLQVRNDADLAATTVAQSLRRAQLLSQASDGDTSWGVKVQPGALTLFRGLNFASRNPTFDELYDLSASFTVSGLDEVIFTKFTGKPLATGTVTLTTPTNETRVVTINSEGMVSY